jgi:predicted glycoside hydrolase/deacetylase ChbG (UPF0249 family)
MTDLIVNADDFGLHSSVNTAIADCVDLGSVNSVSVIANSTAPDYALLKRLMGKNIFMGIHLTWVSEPWITEPIHIFDWSELIIKLLSGGEKFRMIMRQEAEVQIQRLIENDIYPDHIDSHQHIHHIPGVWSMVCELKKKYKIDKIRVARVQSKELLRKNLSGLGLQVLAGTKPKQPSNFYCSGINYSGNHDQRLFAEELRLSSGYNTELIVHPGKDNSVLNQKYSHWHFNWEKEFAALMRHDFVSLTEKNNFRLLRK